MLYIEGGSTITYQPKRDISNNINTILTFPTNDANTSFTNIYINLILSSTSNFDHLGMSNTIDTKKSQQKMLALIF